jgi:inhibitor of KinA sporulation pathway (predicted exonuclease)
MGSAARLLNVIDVEATCWAGNPPPGQASEIIEIGPTVVDIIAGVRVNRHRILVRRRDSSVSAFCADPDRSDPS